MGGWQSIRLLTGIQKNNGSSGRGSQITAKTNGF
jgi:hypothetical protein